MMRDRSIFIKNIYYMLSYAFKTLRESTYENIRKESFNNVNNLFAAILARGIGLQLKQGLYREYINRVEEMSVVRGKIDIVGTIRQQMAHKMAVTCDYDELSENNLLNQILKSTVFLLLKQRDVQKEYKAVLKKDMLFFANVEEIDLRQIPWSSLRFQRNNRTYQLLLAICQFLIEDSLLTTEHGKYRLRVQWYTKSRHKLNLVDTSQF